MAESPQITLLYGNDEFAINAHIDKICAGLGSSTEADMNIARFDRANGHRLFSPEFRRECCTIYDLAADNGAVESTRGTKSRRKSKEVS